MTIYGRGCRSCAKAERCHAECTGWEERPEDRAAREAHETELADARRKGEL